MREGFKPKNPDTSFKCLRATESVRGTKPLLLGMTNTRELSDPGNIWNIALSADTGHKCEPSKSGSGMVTKSLLF